MSDKSIEVCILAAGKGSRMHSQRPKVLHQFAGRPLLFHLLRTVKACGLSRVHVVIGQEAEQVKSAFPEEDVNWVMQEKRLGTGHAVVQATEHFAPDSRVIILLGDAPLITSTTLEALVGLECDLGVLSVDMIEPFNYGRIVRDATGNVSAIVEERDATEEQKAIKEINTGCMIATSSLLQKWLSSLDNDDDQGEYLLTDIVAIAAKSGCRVSAHKASEAIEVTGINTFEQLAALEREHQLKNAREFMDRGVHIIDPNRFDLRGELTVGKDVVIDVNVILEGKVEIADGATIGPNCVITDSKIGQDSVIKANSVIEETTIDNGCRVGPFARLRPGTHLKSESAVGNFVEVKKSTLGEGTKASHLSYLGDSTIGRSVNIGAGTITCNYDGVNKFETHIKDHVFVGSNTALVAPVTIGEGSSIGAGSTITSNVDDNVLAVSRTRQKTITQWKRPKKR